MIVCLFVCFQVLLIVNVASQCGYTDQHYKELVQLQTNLSENDFNVLAFPCNQFGHQEPMRNSAIARFVKEKYKVNFPVFSKVKVIGPDAHPIYKYLSGSIGMIPEWNFGKYLVSRAGKVIQFWNQRVSPLNLGDFIKNHVNMAMADEFEVYNIYNEL